MVVEFRVNAGEASTSTRRRRQATQVHDCVVIATTIPCISLGMCTRRHSIPALIRHPYHVSPCHITIYLRCEYHKVLSFKTQWKREHDIVLEGYPFIFLHIGFFRMPSVLFSTNWLQISSKHVHPFLHSKHCQ